MEDLLRFNLKYVNNDSEQIHTKGVYKVKTLARKNILREV